MQQATVEIHMKKKEQCSWNSGKCLDTLNGSMQNLYDGDGNSLNEGMF
jgi:hypothetical protein